LSWIIQSERN